MFIAGERMGLSENKFVRLSGTRLPEQKPFRGFDITSLIRKDGAEEERASSVNRAESKSTNLGQRSRRLHQSSNMLTSKVWGQKVKISFFCRRRQKEPNAGCRLPLLVPKHQRGSPPVASDQPVHQPLQLEPLPAVPWPAPCEWGRTPGSS